MSSIDELIDHVRDRRNLPAPEVRRAVRKDAGLSLADVADALGVSRQAVAHWEHGARHPRPEHLRKYAELLRRLMGETA